MNTETQDQAAPATDSRFFGLMQVHRHGEMQNDLSAALRDITQAAQLMGKPAKMTVTIVVKPAAQIKGAVLIEDDIKVTLPKPERENSIFYATEDGTLLREDPKQMKLQLRVIEAPAVSEQGAESLKKVGAM